MNQKLNGALHPSRSMHIRILAGRLDRTAGSHVYHYELARRLSDRGYHVSVLAFRSESPKLTDVALQSVRIPDFSSAPLVWRYASILKRWYCEHAIRADMVSAPDVVIGGEHLWLKGHYRRFSGVPWIYLPHGLTVRDEIENSGLRGVQLDSTLNVYRKIQSWALSHADCVLRFTRAGCLSLKSEYSGVNFPPLVVNEIGIEAPKSVERREISGPLRLLIVGQLIYRKGIDLALKSLAEMKGLPWTLTIVGSGGEREALAMEAQRLGLEHQVDFVGPTESPERWYSQSDLLLFPSRSESLGLVALEAMAHGTACLAFRPDGTQFRTVSDEFISHERTGLLAESVGEFADLLRAALEERSKIVNLGQAARQEVLRRYSWEGHLSRYDTLFEWLRLPMPRKALEI